MKALFVSPAGGAYGSERSMLALLRCRQFDAEVVCPGGGVLEHELSDLGIKVYPLEFGKYSVRENPLWHAVFFHRFRQILKQCNPEVIIINLDGNTPLVTIAAVLQKIPIVRFSRFEFKAPTRWLDRWCWLKAKAIICPSEMVQKQVFAWAPPEIHARVHHIYDSYSGRPVGKEEVDRFAKELNLDCTMLIGYVGRLHRGKRIETAVEALAEVRKQLRNANLLIIGAYTTPEEMAYKHELELLASDLGIADGVVFTGFLPSVEMPAAFAAFNVCVLPSESESFGMVLMESWSQGVPTVASDVGGCQEITKASKGGILASVGSIKEFSDGLLALLSSPEEAAAMGRSGMRWVTKNCDCECYAKTFLAICSSSLNYR